MQIDANMLHIIQSDDLLLGVSTSINLNDLQLQK